VKSVHLKLIGVSMAVATKRDPKKWAAAKARARAKMGGHSARAMQLAVKYYKDAGGKYKGKKKKSNKLSKWTKQKWRTKSGKPSKKTGERYLPEKAIKSLSAKEYAATTRAKRAGTRRGKQFVKQPKKIARKTRRYRT
jgi:allophanate hydrolase subunit 2